MVSNHHDQPLGRHASGRYTEESLLLVHACRGFYTAADTAAYFGINPKTVSDIWNRALVDPTKVPAPPNIFGTRTTPDLILADTQILLDRGLTLTEVAEILGTNSDHVREIFGRAGRRYFISDRAEARMMAKRSEARELAAVR